MNLKNKISNIKCKLIRGKFYEVNNTNTMLQWRRKTWRNNKRITRKDRRYRYYKPIKIGKTEKLNIKRDKYENVEFLGWLQDDRIAKYINSADICLAGHFNLENPRANREIPGKAFIYKAMGQKIILGDSEANREVFKEDNKTIFYVERGNYKKLAEMIEKIYEAKL